MSALIEIRYTRPPDRVTVFRQQLVHQTTACVVTLLEQAAATVTVRGSNVLERGSPIVWFTFPGLWHDIGRFHTRDGTFTGYYANVLTPVRFSTARTWETTDLFLDVWLDNEGPVLLDEDQLAAALRDGSVTEEDAARARSEARGLLARAASGMWPPAVCAEWTLERARAALRGADGTPGGATV